MSSENLFNDLFIFEMANNHQGDVEHGKKIIREMGTLAKKYKLRAAVKLQFRHYDTFIHPKAIEEQTNRHVNRFLSTRLSEEEFHQFVKETRDQGMIPLSTPFDENSLYMFDKFGIEMIKIGSPSLRDMPLLEKVREMGKPVIISSGGLNQKEIDHLVTFFQKKNIPLGLMHCVSIYPTPEEQLNLNCIQTLSRRYPGVTVGFSTHEDPNNFDAIKLAYLKGARMFEKHVAVPTEKYSINKYSANPEQAEKWIQAYLSTQTMLGSYERNPAAGEVRDLSLLSRGVFVNRDVKAGETITRDDVFYAFPIDPKGITTSCFYNLSNTLVADRDYSVNDPISIDNVDLSSSSGDNLETTLQNYLYDYRQLLFKNRSKLPIDCTIELSHHYGLENFDEHGCLLIECFSTEKYAKKYLALLPGQTLPTHHHRQKDECFFLIDGDLKVILNGNEVHQMKCGEVVRAKPGVTHSFYSKNGCLFEEVSTGIVPNDSFYQDEKINQNSNRKTRISDNWLL